VHVREQVWVTKGYKQLWRHWTICRGLQTTL